MEECKNSKISEEEAEDMVLKFLRDNSVESFTCPLAGNSIYMDRMFISTYMPRLNQHLHYRTIDVSTVKELCKRWNKTIFSKTPPKQLIHRGMDDIKESLAELKYYKQFMFRSNE